jgi:hypothetical protein
MHTSIGRIITSLYHGDLLDEMHGREAVTPEERQTMIEVVTDVAHYVVDQRIMDLVAQQKVEDSIKAMIAAGIRALPFDPMLLEFPGISDKYRERAFVRLQTKELRPGMSQRAGDVYAYPYCMLPYSDGDNHLFLSLRAGVGIPITFDDEYGIRAAVSTVNDPNEYNAEQHLGMTVVAAMLVAMFMLNTRGVITERISTDKLNRARAQSGKPRINSYTVVRIGHIYDRAGRAHDVNTTGRHMPVHWRSAHVRNVRYGTFKEPAKHRPILIPACLVNFKPADDAPVPLPHKEVTV